MCKIHPTQSLTHYIESTKELICIYCAYTRVKQEPKLEIIEITEKCLTLSDNLQKIIKDNNDFISLAQNQEEVLQSNLDKEKNKLEEVFNSLIGVLEQKKKEILDNLQSCYSLNGQKLLENKHFLIKQQDEIETVKLDLDILITNTKSNGGISSNNFYECLKRYKDCCNSYENNSHITIDIDENEVVFEDINTFLR